MNGETRFTLRPALGHLCAIAVGVYFVYAAYPKIIDPIQFGIDIRNFKILPEQYSNLAALFMPWLEVTSALALIWPRTRRAGAILIGGLLLLFIAAVYWAAIHNGLDIKCGCTGKDSDKAGWSTILRNVALLAGVFLSVAWLPKSRTAPASPPSVLPAEAA